MKNSLIIHVPHASTTIPFYDGYIVDRAALEKEMLQLTDWYTDDLFHSQEDEMIVAGFSRIFCDPERFEEDDLEVMSRRGMGVLYERSDAGEPIRTVTLKPYRERVLDGYYRPHHARLSRAVDDRLARFGRALIVDAHSYPASPLKRDLDQRPDRPDFNIGTDPFHTPRELIDLSVSFFDKAGFTLGVDWPYTGSIVPQAHYRRSADVHSIMLEINRALYLCGPGHERSENYPRIKELTGSFLRTLRSAWVG